jgi:hypothetical protein
MTVIASNELIGIDLKIKQIQDILDEYFTSIWNGAVSVYGRIYETKKGNKSYMEAWTSGHFYKEIFINSKENATIGFFVKSKSIEDFTLKATVQMIVTGNLDKLLTSATRKDERIYLQVYNGLHNCLAIIPKSIKNPKEGVSDVFSGFETRDIKYKDMQPWFCLSFEFDIYYSEFLS